jgi:hypothetical protein
MWCVPRFFCGNLGMIHRHLLFVLNRVVLLFFHFYGDFIIFNFILNRDYLADQAE